MKPSKACSAVSISFIIPTKGRATLALLIDRLRSEIGPQDQVIVVGDGRQLLARGCVPHGDPRFEYHEAAGNWFGNPQRDLAMSHATGDFLMFADDDDNYVPGFIAAIRPLLAAAPRAPHVFRIPGCRPGNPPIAGNIGGAMFVPPNVQSKLASWEACQNLHPASRGKDSDSYFIAATLSFYPDGPIFHNESIYLVRPDNPWQILHQLSYRGVPQTELLAGAELYLKGAYDELNALADHYDPQEAYHAA